MIEMIEYKSVFLEEYEEQLQLMENEILKLEQHGESIEGIQSLFRAAHTLKGSSAAMGLEQIKDLTHEMENLLDKVRGKQLQLTSRMVNLLFKCLDQLKVLKEEYADEKNTAVDIVPLVIELRNYTSEGNGSELDQEKSAKLEIPLNNPNSITDQLKPVSTTFLVKVQINPNCEMKAVRTIIIQSELNTWGNVIATTPALEAIDDSFSGEVNFVFEANADALEVKNFVLALMDIAKVDVILHPIEETELNKEIAPTSIEQMEPGTHNRKEKHKSQTIRVNVERLDHLMNLVGELVIDQTRINQVDKTLNQKYVSDNSLEELGQISDHISSIIGDLQENVMKLRMLPIEQVFNRFPRMVRDLSQNLNKEVELVIEGSETELDRTLIDEIGDPLIHLIRNAIDHGIEDPQTRKRIGKEARGILRIKATHENNHVIVVVEDDGAGIDSLRIKESAIRKGVISKEEASSMSDQEAIKLIFKPGFSTASTLSDVSGRGVGMDIVRSHIQMLNGLIEIETELGKGTRFIIKLPLTLAIITGLLVKLSELSERTFIIPMGNVAEIIRILPSELQTIRGEFVVIIRNQVIPVVWLQHYFNITKTKLEKTYIPLVIVNIGEKRVALAVDALIGNQEIVIKSLGSYVGKNDCISGATILGDGRVALILDVAGVIKLTC